MFSLFILLRDIESRRFQLNLSLFASILSFVTSELIFFIYSKSLNFHIDLLFH